MVAESGSWRVVLPPRRVIDAHLALVRTGPSKAPFGTETAVDLIRAYRAATAALRAEFGSSGFMITFALDWEPGGTAVGEPDPIGGPECVVQVYGRRPGEAISPVRVLARPRADVARHGPIPAA